MQNPPRLMPKDNFPGTLQNLRINGTLTFTKIGGIMYYNYSDIEKVLNGNTQKKVSTLFK